MSFISSLSLQYLFLRDLQAGYHCSRILNTFSFFFFLSYPHSPKLEMPGFRPAKLVVIITVSPESRFPDKLIGMGKHPRSSQEIISKPRIGSGPETARSVRHSPRISGQVYSDETGLRSSQKVKPAFIPLSLKLFFNELYSNCNHQHLY